MKLLELLPELEYFKRIRRIKWSAFGICDFYLVKSEYESKGLIKIDIHSMQIGEYMLTIADLTADDWEIIQ
jgi:hypothetical protein